MKNKYYRINKILNNNAIEILEKWEQNNYYCVCGI